MILILFAILVSPIREVTEYSDIVNDVQSQLQAGHDYTCSNPITTVHECTHGINSRLRGIYKKPCFYVLGNEMFTFPEPKGTLKQVAESIPLKHRGSLYQLYLIDAQKWWNNQPSYVLDELSAYLNALQARSELKRTDRKEISDYVAEFIVYSVYVEGNRKYVQHQINRAVKLGVYLDVQFLKEKGYDVPKKSETMVH